MSGDFKGRTALITGASQGLGAATAKIFAAEGCHVYVNCSRGVEKAALVAAGIQRSGGSAEVFQCDISNETEVAEKFKTLRPVDILVNNARLNPYHRAPEDSEAEWFAKMLSVNLIGPHLCMLAVIGGMKERRWGRIVNISSVQEHLAVPMRMAHYAASKAGLGGLSRCFALDAAPCNVTVNTVSPGMIITENIGRNLSPEEVAEREMRIPLRRGASADEIALAVLCAAKSGYMTGEIVNVNGGLWMTP
jgi:3-oxoacyl-[acyl-carrier protein] reductase